MSRIKLIVTGDVEKLALVDSLRRFFPDACWDKPRKVHAANNVRISEMLEPTKQMVQVAQALLDEAVFGAHGTPADLVVVVEDLELANIGQEAEVVARFRLAIAKVLEKYELRTRTRYGEVLREKCSYHLLVPMVESYFFGDKAALAAAGVVVEPVLLNSDVEDFACDDPLWRPTCEKENQTRQQRDPWWRHEAHPKHYLEHLVERSGGFYRETEQGRDALKVIRWPVVPASSNATPVIRALFEDLADWFGVTNPLGSGVIHPSLYPSRTTNRSQLVLRNF